MLRPSLSRCRFVNDTCDAKDVPPGTESPFSMMAPFSAEASFGQQDGAEPEEVKLWKFELRGDLWHRIE